MKKYILLASVLLSGVVMADSVQSVHPRDASIFTPSSNSGRNLSNLEQLAKRSDSARVDGSRDNQPSHVSCADTKNTRQNVWCRLLDRPVFGR